MSNFLLAYKYKPPGWCLVILGVAGAVFYLFFDFRLVMPVFAIYSSFFETKFFSVFKTNITDELILISLLTGFFLVVFSGEKNESEHLPAIRNKALRNALILNNIFLFVSILFVFGNGFILILVFNLFSFSIFYLLFFHFLKRGYRS